MSGRRAEAAVREQVPRLALDQAQAAAALGVSVNHFRAHVHPNVPRVVLGRRFLYPVRGLETWLDRSSYTVGD